MYMCTKHCHHGMLSPSKTMATCISPCDPPPTPPPHQTCDRTICAMHATVPIRHTSQQYSNACYGTYTPHITAILKCMLQYLYATHHSNTQMHTTVPIRHTSQQYSNAYHSTYTPHITAILKCIPRYLYDTHHSNTQMHTTVPIRHTSQQYSNACTPLP